MLCPEKKEGMGRAGTKTEGNRRPSLLSRVFVANLYGSCFMIWEDFDAVKVYVGDGIVHFNIFHCCKREV